MVVSSSSRGDGSAQKSIVNDGIILEFEENLNFKNYVGDDFDGQEKEHLADEDRRIGDAIGLIGTTVTVNSKAPSRAKQSKIWNHFEIQHKQVLMINFAKFLMHINRVVPVVTS